MGRRAQPRGWVGRSRIGLLVAGVAAAGLWLAGGSAGAAPMAQQFTTPGASSFAVPAAVCFVTITADGGHGGHAQSGTGGAGGVAAMVEGRVGVSPGSVLSVLVAGGGAPGTASGGGRPITACPAITRTATVAAKRSARAGGIAAQRVRFFAAGDAAASSSASSSSATRDFVATRGPVPDFLSWLLSWGSGVLSSS